MTKEADSKATFADGFYCMVVIWLIMIMMSITMMITMIMMIMTRSVVDDGDDV